MPTLIKDGAVAVDEWEWLEDTDRDLPTGPTIVPLALWLEQKADLVPNVERIGVWLNGDEDVSQLADYTDVLPLIAVNFPVFTDGRGFSAGRLLRERHHFTGELRATGYFLQDQLCYLRRCGFNAFSLPDGIDADSALASHQAGVDQPLPLFRRRAG